MEAEVNQYPDVGLNTGELLTAIAVLLAIVTILLALAGIAAFWNLRSIARKTAKEEAAKAAAEVAAKAAAEVAESASVRYLEAELPNIYREYVELARNAASYDEGDDIAEKQGG